MLESFSSSKFEYKKLSPEEQKQRGILGRLQGCIADTKNPTRNGRLYGLELWNKVFSDPIMQEKINNRCLFMELGHPEDRNEVDMEKICACMAEQPKVGKDGLIYGVIDILPTANGHILKTLCDYGTTVGISSRGTGDIITDEDGNEAVDPDTYECETFDIVIVPAVENARLQYVTESLDTSKDKLQKALKESLASADEHDREIMKNTLHDLKIDINIQEDDNIKHSTSQTIKESVEAIDDGTSVILKSLQEAIKDKSRLEEEIRGLQEKLAVSDAKASQINEELEKYKSTTAKLGTLAHSAKDLSKKVSKLEEDLEAKDNLVKTLESRNTQLLKEHKTIGSGLKEEVGEKDKKIAKLNESIAKQRDEYEEKLKSLNEEFEAYKKSSNSKVEKLTTNLTQSRKTSESYKMVANKIVERYIDTKATMLGLDKNEIKNKLSESYTLDDVDTICEELQSFTLSINKLPFDVKRNARVVITESKNESIRPSSKKDVVGEDEVDGSLLKMAGLQ